MALITSKRDIVTSSAWFTKKIRELVGAKVSFTELAKTTELTSRAEIGKMYGFVYDPKTKKKLPFYDRFPLVIPIERYSDGFLGINLHYLPPKLRAMLLQKLLTIASSKKLSDRSKFRISYQILAGATRFSLFRPTVKRYLSSHVRTKFLRIPPNEWDVAIFLPTERFTKADASTVWRDSRRKIR